jgi:hypothetical protein
VRLADRRSRTAEYDGKVEAAAERLPGADLVIEAGPGIRGLMAGKITPASADRSG